MAGRSIANLAIEITGNIAGFQSDLGRAQREADKTFRNMERDAKRIGAQIGVALGVAVVGAAAGIKKSIDEFDRLGDVSARIGVSTKALSELGYAAEQTGSSGQALEGGLARLSRTMAEAAAGGDQQKRIFESLGVAVTDSSGKLRTADAVFKDIARKFKGFANDGAEMAIAQKLMGRSASELIPLLNSGAEGIETYADEAARFNVVVGDDSAAAAQEFNDNLTKLNKIVVGVFNGLATQLLPSLVQLSAQSVDSASKTAQQANSFDALSGTIKVLAGGAIVLKNVWESVVDVFLAGLGTFKLAGGVVEELSDSLGAGLASNLAFLQGDFAGGLAILEDAHARSGDAMAQSIAEVTAGWQAARDGLTENFRDIGDGIGALFDPIDKLGKTTKRAGEEADEADAPLDGLATTATRVEKEFKDAASVLQNFVAANKRLNDILDASAGVLGDDMVRAAIGFKNAMVDIAQAERDLAEAGPLSPEDLQRLAQARAQATEAYRRETAAIKAQLTPAQQLIRDLREEIRLNGLSNDEREKEIALRGLAAEEVEQYGAKIRALLDTIQQQRASVEFSSSFTEAFSAFAAGIAQGQNGFEALRNVGTDAINDLIGHFGKLLKASTDAETGVLDFGKLFDKVIKDLGSGDSEGVLGALGNIAGAFAQASGGGWGGALAGAVSGAIQGFMSGGFYGAIIGAILGGVSGYGDEQEPKLSVATGVGSLGTEAMLTGPFGRINVGDRDLSATPMQTAQAVQDFDRQIALMLNNVQEGLAAAALRTFNFRGEGGEATVGEALEARLETISRAVFEAPVAEFLRTFSNDLQQQLQVFGDLLALDKIVKRGDGLFDNLPAIVEHIRQFQQAGETIGQTYTRLAESFGLYDEAMALHHEAINAAMPGIVAFATEITDAAGGIEEARRLWNAYFDTFFTAEERAEIDLQQAQGNLDKELADIGLDSDISKEDFKQRFKDLLPSLDPEDVVQWLQAAAAFGMLEEAEQALADARREGAEAVDAAAEAELRRAQALDALMTDVAFERYLLTLTEQEQEIARINRETEEMVAQAIELGASEEQLAEIRAYGQERIDALTQAEEEHAAAVTLTTSTLIEAGMTLEGIMARVMGVLGQTGSIEDKLAALGAAWRITWKQANELGADANQLNLIRQAAGVEMRNLIEREIAAIESQLADARRVADGIRSWLDSQPFGNTSSASASTRMNEAQRQFNDLLLMAPGDVNAQRDLTRLADQLLREAAGYYGVGSTEFAAIEAFIRASLEPFTNVEVDEALLDELAHLNDVLANLELFLTRYLGPIVTPLPPPAPAPTGTPSNALSSNRDVILAIEKLGQKVDEAARVQATAYRDAAAAAMRDRKVY